MKLKIPDIVNLPHFAALDCDRSSVVLTGVSTDSRSVKSGDLFVPIRGAQFDGHNFLSNAVKSGARAVLVEKRWADMNSSYLVTLPVPKIIVEDTVHSLGRLARNYRRLFKIPVIAVAGSNGKTTTKEMIKSVLASTFEVLATEGNLNNHIGVPLTLFRIEKKHEFAVVEIGTNHPGEIEYLCGIAEPTCGLITNIGFEHLEFFGDLAGVAKAELELFRWMKSNKQNNATFFINGDDQRLARQSGSSGRTVVFGMRSKRATVRGSGLTIAEDGAVQFTVKARGLAPFSIALRLPGIQNARNALAATAVGIRFDVPVPKIQRALKGFSAPRKRMEMLKIDGLTILNDTYNSNPDSAKAALETLRMMKSAGKKIAVLADMLELGGSAQEEHRAIASHVDNAGVEYLLTYGPLSRATYDASTVKVKAHYDQKNILSEYLAELLAPGDIVLVKGSRGMKMEDVVTFLQERFSKAA